MAIEHTPGPWEWHTSNSYNRLGAGDEEIVYAVKYRDGQPGIEWKNDADARLIAAAPDLLLGYEELLSAVKREHGDEHAWFGLIRESEKRIAEARGVDPPDLC